MRYLAIIAVLAAGYAQSSRPPVATEGTPPKASAAEYPVQAESGNLELGADYLVHSFGTGEQMYLAENYLVVEVALFPPKGESVMIDSSKFSLRVNGKKALILPHPAAMAAANLNRRDWQQSRGPMADLGVGGIGVGLGYPKGGPQVPGAPQDRRLPAPPRAPDAYGRDDDMKPVVRAEDILLRTALPDGTFKGPISGFLYFPYTGKVGSVKTTDLLFQDVVLKLK